MALKGAVCSLYERTDHQKYPMMFFFLTVTPISGRLQVAMSVQSLLHFNEVEK